MVHIKIYKKCNYWRRKTIQWKALWRIIFTDLQFGHWLSAHVRTCAKRVIFIGAMFWGAGPLHHTVPSSWEPIEVMSGFNTGKNWPSDQPVWLQLLDTTNLITVALSLFALGPVHLRAKWMIYAEPQCSAHGFSVRVLSLPSGCLLGF